MAKLCFSRPEGAPACPKCGNENTKRLPPEEWDSCIHKVRNAKRAERGLLPAPWNRRVSCTDCGHEWDAEIQQIPDFITQISGWQAKDEAHKGEKFCAIFVQWLREVMGETPEELIDAWDTIENWPRQKFDSFGKYAEAGGIALVRESEAEAPQEAKTGADWRDVQARLLRLRGTGEEYTSQRTLADQLECSVATINKAINNSDTLRGWKARHTKCSPKAQSLNEVVTDNTASHRERDPAVNGISDDEVDLIMTKLIEDAKPTERAKLNEMNKESRREMAKLISEQKDEPDSGPLNLDDRPKPIKLRGRKP